MSQDDLTGTADADTAQPHRRDVIRKGVLAAGVAGIAWSAPRIDGLSVRPDYAAAATGGATDQGGDTPQPQDFTVDFDVQNTTQKNQGLPLGNFGGVTLHALLADTAYDIPDLFDIIGIIHVLRAQATVTWDGLPGACSLSALDVDYTAFTGAQVGPNSQSLDTASGVFQFENIPVPFGAGGIPNIGVHARFTCT